MGKKEPTPEVADGQDNDMDGEVDEGCTDDEYVLPEPDTGSVPPSPVTGQTADESQEKPGQ